MNRVKGVVGIVLIVALICPLFAGCASTGKGRREQAKGTAAGAVIGAAVGAAIGAALGGGRGAAAGAIAGATMGGMVGYIYASRVYDDIERASNKAAAIDTAAQQNASYIAGQSRDLDDMAKRSKELDEETAMLASEYTNNKVTAEALAAEKAKTDKEVAEARQVLITHQQELAYLQEWALPVVQKHGTQAQIQRLEGQISTVEEQNSKMEKVIEESASYSQRLIAG